MKTIRIARVTAGLTQKRLGELADLDQSEISRLELGKMTLTVPVLLRLSTALQVRPEQLIAPMMELRQ